MNNFDGINKLELKVILSVITTLATLLATIYFFPFLTAYTFVLLAVYALLGLRQSIQALFLAFLIKSLNPAIFISVDSTALFHWIVLYTSAAKILITSCNKKVIPKAFLSTASLCYFAFFVSSISGFSPFISLLKLTSFILFSVTTVTVIYILRKDVNYWLSWLFSIYLFVCVTSLPFINSPAGYAAKGNGLFQGILAHPQLYGIFCSPFVSLLVWKTITDKEGFRKNSLTILSTALGLFAIFSSGARTSLFASILSIFISPILFALFRTKELKRILLSRKAILVYTTATLIYLFSFSLGLNDNFHSSINSFVNKGRHYESFDKLAEDSRGSIIQKSLDNFYNYPLIGIGFGLPSDYKNFEATVGVGGIPLSIPTLKGSLPSAVLEETGIVGSLAFVFFLSSSCRYISLNAGLPILSLYLTIFFVNLGESNILSFGGVGQYFWFLIAISFAYASLGQRLKNQ
jgi:hypothetical protein